MITVKYTVMREIAMIHVMTCDKADINYVYVCACEYVCVCVYVCEYVYLCVYVCVCVGV